MSRSLHLAFLLACASACSSRSQSDADAATDASVADVAPDAPIASITFTLAQEAVVREVTAQHLAFPDVVRLRDGRLLVVYREGRTHVDATGRIMKQFGSADALTWSAPEVLVDTPSIDDRDPSVTVLPNGDVLVNWFQYLPQGNLTVHHVYVTRSTDNGATFGTAVEVDHGPLTVTSPQLDAQGLWVDSAGQPVIVQASSSSVISTVGDRLLLPAYGGNALNLSNLNATPRSRLTLYASNDSGDTWTALPVAPARATDTWLMEPAIMRLDDGSLLMQLRTAAATSPSSAGHLLQTVSTDDGATFSDYRDLGFVGHAPELVQLHNGVVVSAFRYLDDALTTETVSMMASVDRGATWGDQVVIHDCSAVECGYPGLLELDGDRLLVVYYAPGGTAIDAAIYSFAVTRN